MFLNKSVCYFSANLSFSLTNKHFYEAAFLWRQKSQRPEPKKHNVFVSPRANVNVKDETLN